VFQITAQVGHMPELPALEIENLRKAYAEPGGGRLPVLDIARFEVAAGEQVVIRGESGGGKTTLLHAIAGVTQVDSGSIRIAGTDIARLPEAARDIFRARNIGYVFQTFNLLAGFSALENVLLGMTFTGQRTDVGRARGLLEKVGLAERWSHKPSALSVGQQQRVAVARALANRPKLMLADEPTANVDPAHQQQVIDLLRSACRDDRIALLWVTHSDEVAGQFERAVHLETFNQPLAAAP
jgi:putative ABC transport system ATP-binding protein